MEGVGRAVGGPGAGGGGGGEGCGGGGHGQGEEEEERGHGWCWWFGGRGMVVVVVRSERCKYGGLDTYSFGVEGGIIRGRCGFGVSAIALGCVWKCHAAPGSDKR